ncbi:hypothetical protein R1sor_024895 [Riccia sorocarpa]|uniref:Uncharacterized protein n=1 Tax=Riccia sorocarpa TaxID=122646 RepID=A0ABD3GVS4_9MARC
MTGYERNYDFADLIHCASGLNRLASMEYGEENISSVEVMQSIRPFGGETSSTYSEVALDPVDTKSEGFEGEHANSNAVGDLWDLVFPVHHEGSDSEHKDGVDDLTILGHETRHVMSEALQQISSEDQESL